MQVTHATFTQLFNLRAKTKVRRTYHLYVVFYNLPNEALVEGLNTSVFCRFQHEFS